MNDVHGLPDYLAAAMRILFIGYNPGLRSAEIGHHYAGRGNSFFPLLFRSGLVDEPLTYEDDWRLLTGYGYGLTNLVARPTAGIKDLKTADYREGRGRLLAVLRQYQPRVAAYVGLGVYRYFSGRQGIGLGRQDRPLVQGVMDFVLPSTSGLNALPPGEKERWFKQLREEVASLR